MSPRNQTKVDCCYCHQLFPKRSMNRHLMKCPERSAHITESAKRKSRTESLFHLRVQDSYNKDYWLHLEVPGSASLEELDYYLRYIWLECCGHMSRFSIGGWSGDEIPMEALVAQVFEPGLEVAHIYDFGTSSITLLEALASRDGKSSRQKPIELMARNSMPEALCIDCGEPAPGSVWSV